MPPADVYVREYRYMPWQLTITAFLDQFALLAPQGARVLDLMSGPGHMSELIVGRRPDIELVAVDNNPAYIEYAIQTGLPGRFLCADILSLSGQANYDIVLCIGALHHLAKPDQFRAVQLAHDHLASGGYFLLAEPCVRPYATEQDRQLAAAELGYFYLRDVIIAGAPKEILRAAGEILLRDLLLDGEFKISSDQLLAMLKDMFGPMATCLQTWKCNRSVAGDYLFQAQKL